MSWKWKGKTPWAFVLLLSIAFCIGIYQFLKNPNVQPPLECYNCSGKADKFKQIRTILSFTKEEQELVAQFIDSLVIIEGDIIIGNVEEYDVQTLAVITGDGVLWDNGLVPYIIQKNHPDEKLIKKAIKELNSVTNIKLVPRVQEKDYVFFINKPEGGVRF